MIPFFAKQSVLKKRLALVQRMSAMVYSSKDFESLCFFYQAEGHPKNISIEEFCVKHGVDHPTFDKWYRKTHKKVFPVNVTGKPEEDAEIQVEVEKVTKESKVHTPISHPFKRPLDRVLISTRKYRSASSSLAG